MIRFLCCFLLALFLAVPGCGENGNDNGNDENGPNGGDPNGDPEDDCEGEDQEITFEEPVDTASVPVRPCFDTTDNCLRVRATFCRPVEDHNRIEAYLEKDGDRLPGSIQYRWMDRAVVFQPFAILESQSTYEAVIIADGVEARLELTTEAASEGAVPDIEGSTFAFNIEEFLWPDELSGIFNTLSSSIPDNLINVNELIIDESTDPSDQTAIVNMVGAAAELGSNPPELIQEDHEGGVFTSTGLQLEGRVRGSWFIIGPSSVNLVASGVPFTVRGFVASGVFSETGDRIETGFLTGFLNIEDLGDAVGYDLSTICTSAATENVCDDDGNARLAARIGADTVDIGFDCFMTSPVNKSLDNPPTSSIEVHCTHPLEESTELFLELCDGSEDAPDRAEEEGGAATWSCYVEEGVEVEGSMSIDGKVVTFQPAGQLASGAWYRFGLYAVRADDPDQTQARHSVFRVQ